MSKWLRIQLKSMLCKSRTPSFSDALTVDYCQPTSSTFTEQQIPLSPTRPQEKGGLAFRDPFTTQSINDAAVSSQTVSSSISTLLIADTSAIDGAASLARHPETQDPEGSMSAAARKTQDTPTSSEVSRSRTRRCRKKSAGITRPERKILSQETKRASSLRSARRRSGPSTQDKLQLSQQPVMHRLGKGKFYYEEREATPPAAKERPCRKSIPKEGSISLQKGAVAPVSLQDVKSNAVNDSSVIAPPPQTEQPRRERHDDDAFSPTDRSSEAMKALEDHAVSASKHSFPSQIPLPPGSSSSRTRSSKDCGEGIDDCSDDVYPGSSAATSPVQISTRPSADNIDFADGSLSPTTESLSRTVTLEELLGYLSPNGRSVYSRILVGDGPPGLEPLLAEIKTSMPSGNDENIAIWQRLLQYAPIMFANLPKSSQSETAFEESIYQMMKDSYCLLSDCVLEEGEVHFVRAPIMTSGFRIHGQHPREAVDAIARESIIMHRRCKQRLFKTTANLRWLRAMTVQPVLRSLKDIRAKVEASMVDQKNDQRELQKFLKTTPDSATFEATRDALRAGIQMKDERWSDGKERCTAIAILELVFTKGFLALIDHLLKLLDDELGDLGEDAKVWSIRCYQDALKRLPDWWEDLILDSQTLYHYIIWLVINLEIHSTWLTTFPSTSSSFSQT